MKIEIRFTVDSDDDATNFAALDGKTVTMEHADDLHIEVGTDIFPDGEGGNAPGDTGALRLNAHGLRAMWSE